MLIISLFATAVYSSSAGGTFGSTDPSLSLYPMDCYQCRAQYGSYEFCNVNNEFGACCPPRSTDSHNCATDSHYNIRCTHNEVNPDLWWTYCIETNSKQCGGHEISTFHSEDDNFAIDVTGGNGTGYNNLPIRRSAG